MFVLQKKYVFTQTFLHAVRRLV